MTRLSKTAVLCFVIDEQKTKEQISEHRFSLWGVLISINTEEAMWTVASAWYG